MTLPHGRTRLPARPGVAPLDLRPLREQLEDAVAPHCPEACPFRILCPTDVQAGAAALFQGGQYASPRDCWRWEALEQLVERELGIPVPGTGDALLEALATPRLGLPADAGDAYEEGATT